MSYHVANATPAEARFLGEVVALFCDPAKRPVLEHLKGARVSISYSEGAGLVLLPIIDAPPNN